MSHKQDSELGTTQSGFWACGSDHCLKRWNWGTDGRFQLFIVGNPNDFSDNLCSYMGDGYENDQIKQELAVLKGSRLLQQIGTQPINTRTILRALEVLGERSERQLMQRLNTVMVTAGNAEKKFGTPLFCESPTLSIPTQGKKYQALYVDGDIPMLKIKELQAIIASCAAFMDYKNAVGSGPAFQKALQSITSRVESLAIQDIVKTTLSKM